MLAAEDFVILGASLASALWIGGRHQVEGGQLIGIFLPLDDKHGLARVSLRKSGEAVQHPADPFGIPDPAPLAIRSALAEGFRLEADHLTEHVAGQALRAAAHERDAAAVGQRASARGERPPRA
jgi:hypothetical protein